MASKDLFAERIRHRVAMSQLGRRLFPVRDALAAARAETARLETELSAAKAALRSALQAEAKSAQDHAEALASLRTKQAAMLNQREVEERRVRAVAVERSVQARAEATDAYAFAVTMRNRAAAAEAAAAQALAQADREQQRADEIDQEARRLRMDLSAAQEALRGLVAERDRLLGSTIWRATWPLRAAGGLVPLSVRRAGREALTAIWWTATGQFGRRIRQRKRMIADAALIAASPLFDAGWYAARYADVQVAAIDPALHYASVGGIENRDPGPHFSAARYMADHPAAAASGRPALLHFLECGDQ